MTALTRQNWRAEIVDSTLTVVAKTSSCPREVTTPLNPSFSVPKIGGKSQSYLSAAEHWDSTSHSVKQQDVLVPQGIASSNPGYSLEAAQDIIACYVPSTLRTPSYESTLSSKAFTEDSLIHLPCSCEITSDIGLDIRGIGSWVDDDTLMGSAWDMPPAPRESATRAPVLSIGSAGFMPFIERVHAGGRISGSERLHNSPEP
ncbi:hypothetical protein DL98DRAFT_652463 [Cadophora sp. DSE1049]|nr:hypothetical protein DL98DRAFT_652463 [Cadophora sp. DSE1049]